MFVSIERVPFPPEVLTNPFEVRLANLYTVSVPIFPRVENKFVELAVVENEFVVVAAVVVEFVIMAFVAVRPTTLIFVVEKFVKVPLVAKIFVDVAEVLVEFPVRLKFPVTSRVY